MTSTGIANILMPTATVANAKQTSAKTHPVEISGR